MSKTGLIFTGGAPEDFLSSSGDTFSLDGESFKLDFAYPTVPEASDLFVDVFNTAVDKVFDGFDTTVVIQNADSVMCKLLNSSDGSGDHTGLIDEISKAVFEAIDVKKDTMEHLVLLSMFALDEPATTHEDLKSSVTPPSVRDMMNPDPETAHHLIANRPHGFDCATLARVELQHAGELNDFYRQNMTLLSRIAPSDRSSATRHVVVELRVEGTYTDSPFVVSEGVLRLVLVDMRVSGPDDGPSGWDANDRGRYERILSAAAKGQKRWNIPFHLSSLTAILKSALGGDAALTFLKVVSTDDSQDAKKALARCQELRAIANKITVHKNTHRTTISELRVAVSKCRSKLLHTDSSIKEQKKEKVPSEVEARETTELENLQALAAQDRLSVRTLETLLKELGRVKRITWEGRRERSAELRIARTKTLQERGYLWFLVSSEPPGAQSTLHSVAKDNQYDEADGLEQLALSHMKKLSDQLTSYATVNFELQRVTKEYSLQFGQSDGKEQGALAKKKKDLEKKMRMLTMQQTQYGNLFRTKQTDKKSSDQKEASVYEEYRDVLSQLVNVFANKESQLVYKTAEGHAEAEALRKLRVFQEMNALVESYDDDKSTAAIPQRVLEEWSRLDDEYAMKSGLVKKQDVKKGGKKVAQLKKSMLENLKKEYAFRKQNVLAEVANDKLLHLCMLSDAQHVMKEKTYRQEILFMFRDYRAYFDTSRRSNQAKYATITAKTVSETLRSFEKFHELSEELKHVESHL